MSKTWTRLLLLSGISALSAFYCSPTSPEHAGNSTQTGNGMIAGVIYNKDGSFARNAKVTLRKKNSLADTTGALLKRLATLPDSATATTNDSGKFVIDSVDTGTYVIVGTDGGNNLALNDSVPVKSKDSAVTLPPDTLKPAGAIKGVIKLSEGGDPRKVFILAFGIDRFARVNADGSFKFSTLAEGKYDLRLISSLDNYGVLDTVNIHVVSADTTDLDTIDLPFTGIPTPKNMVIAYDTLKQIVGLSWGKAAPTLVNGYYVYRRNVDSNTVLARINTSPITDTLYKDSTGTQDQTYEYRVACIDKNATEGTKSAGVSVKVVGAFEFVRAWGSSGSAAGQMNNPVSIATDSKGLVYVADENNNRIQIFDSTGQYKSNFGDSILNAPCAIAIQDSFIFVATDGNKTVFKFTLNGDTLSKFTLPTNSSFPAIGVDNNLNVYVIPSYLSNKIQVYSDNGILNHELPFGLSSQGNVGVKIIDSTIFAYRAYDTIILVQSIENGKIDTLKVKVGNRPVGVASDNNRIFVLNRFADNKGEVLVYSKNLQYLGKWGGNASYIQVTSITSDNFGHIYILDSDNRKISQFKLSK